MKRSGSVSYRLCTNFLHLLYTAVYTIGICKAVADMDFV